MRPNPTTVKWRTSSYSGGTGDCVEVADLMANVAVRDSKDPDAGHLTFTVRTWTAFMAEVRDGRFNLP
ncbi:DUF397 domain-containing protein [Actinomadura sp. GC306]|uniref:DUF397 domain-containing protein n=1 Tax=Actinomadura sp. GC306 TaxID=2530367 RepID=UPI00104FA020|nr:DUF397 domain-containing protein [Actinomadura sp. GC306]TDC70249.1 DUF397 domain-containing protein [Actinomadura sp. GC306]